MHSIHIIRFITIKSTYALFKQFHKIRFSNGFVGNSINVSVKVEADLLLCMPSLGDRIKGGI